MAGVVRQPIDAEAFSRYIKVNVPEIDLPIDIKQFGYGQSNPTYQLTSSTGTKYVMRKKPPGKLLSKTAHQVEREYRIIHALEKTPVPVPKTYGLCEDSTVIGTPFYIMEFLDGRIFEEASFLNVSESDRREMWRSAILTLAALHAVDPKAVGLSDFGRPSGFYNRQIKTLSTISQAQAVTKDVETQEAVGKIPHFDDVVAFFSDSRTQPQDRGTVVHGDYKIDNLVYHKTEPRVIGILDWEMSTIGHPLSDLSNLLSPYTFAASPLGRNISRISRPEAFTPGTMVAGLPALSELRAWYAEAAGWDPRQGTESEWGDAFGIFRNSVIMQGIAARYAVRQASSAQAKENGKLMRPFGEFCWSQVRKVMELAEGKRKARL